MQSISTTLQSFWAKHKVIIMSGVGALTFAGIAASMVASCGLTGLVALAVIGGSAVVGGAWGGWGTWWDQKKNKCDQTAIDHPRSQASLDAEKFANLELKTADRDSIPKRLDKQMTFCQMDMAKETVHAPFEPPQPPNAPMDMAQMSRDLYEVVSTTSTSHNTHKQVIIHTKEERKLRYNHETRQAEPINETKLTPMRPTTITSKREKVGEYEVGISCCQGERAVMEDKHLAVSFDLTLKNGQTYPVHLFGIFDGHAGTAVSAFIKENLQEELIVTLRTVNPDGLTDAGIWEALKLTTIRLNLQFKAKWTHDVRCGVINRYPDLDPHLYPPQTESHSPGSTATFAMILDNNIWTANVGDSRTVLNNGGTAVRLSEDATISNPDPASQTTPRYNQGVLKRGGRIDVGHDGVPRIMEITDNADTGRRVATPRSIGDYEFDGITARPKITVISMNQIAPNSHLNLGSDAIYSFTTTQNLVSAVASRNDLPVHELAEYIVSTAYMLGSPDNLSTIVIPLQAPRRRSEPIINEMHGTPKPYYQSPTGYALGARLQTHPLTKDLFMRHPEHFEKIVSRFSFTSWTTDEMNTALEDIFSRCELMEAEYARVQIALQDCGVKAIFRIGAIRAN
jgi:serine/threonine protein phosphatase PrpC